jgi:hypothetical protein
MQKKLIILSFCCAVTIATKAQLPKVLAYGNVLVAAPNNTDFKNNYNTGFGGEVGVGFGLGKTLLTGSVGYLEFNSYGNNTIGNLQVIPVKLGIRRYLIGKLFVSAQGGLAMQQLKESSISGSPFIYEVGAGVKVLKLIELGLGYNSFTPKGLPYDANSILYKAGFSIKL